MVQAQVTRDQLLEALQHNNVQAFLRVLREGESNQYESAYQIMYGGRHFESFADHPRQYNVAKGLTSTAAGAYQFLSKTWDGLVKQYGFPDFSPINQDCAAVALIAGRKALQAVKEGRLDEAIQLCAREWASLPGSPHGQPTLSQARAREVYEAYGGRIAGADKVEPIHSDPSPSFWEKHMSPLIPIVLQGLSSLIPALSGLGFGSGSEVSKRNVAAGAIIADKLVEVTQAVNLQEAAEKIQNDPALLATAKQAVNEIALQLGEAGGGGIDGARKASASPDALPFSRQGAFYVSLLLLVMPFMLLADVFYVHPDSYDGNLRTQIVTAVLLVISMVGAFWLGSTMSSQRKDVLGSKP